MYTINCDLVGTSPISFSKAISDKKETGEGHDKFEQRIWKKRMHVDKEGNCFIPAMALKNSLSGVAKYLSETVPGKGKATFTKHFEAGVSVVDNLPIEIPETTYRKATINDAKGEDVFRPGLCKASEVEGEEVFVPSDGKKGGGTRVMKTFPVIPEGWKAHAQIRVFDRQIEPKKVEEYLTQAGMFIGLLRWRPRNGGLYGRFKVENFESKEGL